MGNTGWVGLRAILVGERKPLLHWVLNPSPFSVTLLIKLSGLRKSICHSIMIHSDKKILFIHQPHEHYSLGYDNHVVCQDRYHQFAETCCIQLQGPLNETLNPIYQNTWCHIPEDHNLIIHCCENIRPLEHFFK